MKKVIEKLVPRSIGLYYNLVSLFFLEKTTKQVFKLFCTPRKGRVIKEQEAFLDSAKGDVLHVKDHTIQTYKWQGSGETVLLMHGWESNTYRWRNLIPFLQKENYTIIAMDAPAHGHSSGKLLNVPIYTSCAQEVINFYQPKYIIGHSVGGMTLVHNLYKHAEENTAVQKAVTLGSPSELSDFMRQYKTVLGLNKRLIQSLETYFVENYGFRFHEFSSAKFANHITAEGLLIHDTLDTIAPYWSSEQVHAQWKNSRLVSTKGLGHSLHQDTVSEQVIDFLKS